MRSLLLFLSLIVCGSVNAQVTVLNGASFRSDQSLAAGSWATAFGSFTGVIASTAAGYPIPKSLGGVTVTVDGIDAPVYYVSSTQINFLVPYAAATGNRSLSITTGTGTQTGTIRLMPAAPGIFVKDTTNQTPPKGAILNQDFSENTQGAPIHRGQVIQIYATGPGGLLTAVDDGTSAPSAPLVQTKSTPQVYIGGVEAQVQFSGLAPTFAGLWQINAFVPDKPFINGRVPVQVFIDGVDSNEVTIFVAQ
jgi:uncharacterized protein (TIGR03437 family)